MVGLKGVKCILLDIGTERGAASEFSVRPSWPRDATTPARCNLDHHTDQIFSAAEGTVCPISFVKDTLVCLHRYQQLGPNASVLLQTIVSSSCPACDRSFRMPSKLFPAY